MNEIVHTLTDGVLRHLAVGSVAAVVLVLSTLVFLKAARIRTPVYRHMAWLYCLVGIVGLPPIWLHGPKLTLAVLPAQAQTPATVAAPATGLDMGEPLADAGLSPARPLAAEIPSGLEKPVLPWKTVIVAVWFLGVSFMLSRLLVAWLRLRRICGAAAPLPIGEYPTGWPDSGLKLYLTSQLPGPVCFGMFRPVILLPQDMVHLGSRESLRMVLTHELAHVERRDCWANLFQRFVEAMYFFHPLVWLASGQLTQQREEICDNHVLAEGVSAEDYTTLLSRLGTQAIHTPYLQTVALFEGQLLARIRSLLDPARSRQTKLPWRIAALGTAVVLVGFLAFGSVRLAAQPSDSATAASSSASRQQEPAPSLAAPGENPEQPRLAARTFNSTMAFIVWYRDTPGPGWGAIRRAGRTPSVTPLVIPACWTWYVETPDPVKDWDLFVREVSQNSVPGLRLSATDSDLRRLADLSGLEFLDLFRAPVTDAGLAHLARLTRLQWLGLERAKITDAGLEHLRGLTRLQGLDLPDTKITDTGLEHLKDLTRLQQLNLTSTRITDAGLEHLKGLTRLQGLDLRSTKITDAGLERLKGLTGLQTLELEGTQVTDAGLAHLQGMNKLQRLWLAGTQITDAGLEHLNGLSQLQTIVLSDTQIVGTGLEHLKGLTKLRGLRLDATRITDAGLKHLQGLSQLQSLNLSDTQITGAGLAHLQGLTRLETLALCRTPVTDASLAHLRSLTGLGSLNLYGTKITDAGLEHLKGVTGLGSLILSGTQITDAGLEHLNGLSALRSLYLTDTQITDAGLSRLKNLDRLWFLDLSGTQVTDEAVKRLEQNLPKLTIGRDGFMPDWIKRG